LGSLQDGLVTIRSALLYRWISLVCPLVLLLKPTVLFVSSTPVSFPRSWDAHPILMTLFPVRTYILFYISPAPLLLLTHVMCLLRPRAKKRGLRNGNGSDAQVCKTIDFLLSALKSIKINSDFTSLVRGESAWREKSTVVARKRGKSVEN